MVGEKRLAQPVPDCLVFCWPFNMLGSASVESHHKAAAAALVSPPAGAQVKGVVASQRRGPERPPVC